MKVLVTGGAGFIGSNLCERLVATPGVDRVVVIDDLSTGYVRNLEGIPVELIEASILDPAALARAAAGAQAIVHLAALGSVPRSVADPVATHAVNTTGTLHVLQAARAAGNAHVVLASSSSVYGANPLLPKREDQLCMPMSPYAVSKLAAEQYATAFGRCYDLPVLPLRFFNVYGPRQAAGHAYAAVIPVFVDAALRGRPLPVDGDGLQSRDFTYVGSVVDLLVKAVLNRTSSQWPTNLAFGTNTTLLDLIDSLEAILGRELQREWRATRAGDVRDSRADSSALFALMGHAEPVPLERGLTDTVEWMRGTIDQPTSEPVGS